MVEIRQAKYIAGDQPYKRKTAQANEKALRELVGSYLHRPTFELLIRRGVAHHFDMGSD